MLIIWPFLPIISCLNASLSEAELVFNAVIVLDRLVSGLVVLIYVENVKFQVGPVALWVWVSRLLALLKAVLSSELLFHLGSSLQKALLVIF